METLSFYKRVLIRQIAGWILIAIGVAGLILPVLPGWLFLGAGALLLAPHVRLFRRFAAWMHARFPALRGRLHVFRKFQPPPRPPTSCPPKGQLSSHGCAHGSGAYLGLCITVNFL